MRNAAQALSRDCDSLNRVGHCERLANHMRIATETALP
jgi:hypothetical protein